MTEAEYWERFAEVVSQAMLELTLKEKRRQAESERWSGPLIRANQARAEAINHCRKIESKEAKDD